MDSGWLSARPDCGVAAMCYPGDYLPAFDQAELYSIYQVNKQTLLMMLDSLLKQAGRPLRVSEIGQLACEIYGNETVARLLMMTANSIY